MIPTLWGGLRAPLCICISILLATPTAFADKGDGTSSDEAREIVQGGRDDWEVTPELIDAVDRGHDFLIKRQIHDGSWASSNRDGGTYQVAITSIVGLSLLAGGHVPGRGKGGEALDRAIEYILELVRYNQSGHFYITEKSRVDKRSSRMHGHGYATLFLAEAYGMIRDDPERQKLIQEVLQEAVYVIEKSQGDLGGWWYGPKERGRDENSVTVCCAQALRAARNAGIKVNKRKIELALQYIKDCATSEGGFMYTRSSNPETKSFALTAGSVSTLQAFGFYNIKEVRLGLTYMDDYLPGSQKQSSRSPPASVCVALILYFLVP